MQTFKRLPNAWNFCRVSVLMSSFVPKRDIRSMVANTPMEVTPVSVTIVVTVVVTVEIMADNQTLFRCH